MQVRICLNEIWPRRPTVTTISVHTPTPGGSIGGNGSGNYLTVIANNGRGNGGIPLNSFAAADSITLLPTGIIS